MAGVIVLVGGTVARMKRVHRDAAQGAHDIAVGSSGVTSRRRLREVGIDRFVLRTLVGQGRVVLLGTQAVHVRSAGWHEARSPVIAAVFEAGGCAWADGVSALMLAGFTGWEPRGIDIGHTTGSSVASRRGVTRHRTVRAPELRTSPVPYARPDFAAVRAASWAPTDRAAAALLAMVVQQRLTTGADLRQALAYYPTTNRRAVIAAALLDVGGGSHSIDELEFLRHLRRRRLPLPDRQVMRTRPKGRIYLDACWPEARLVVEIDGSHHGVGAAPTLDALRQNAVSLDGDTVLRIPNIALRTDSEPFLDQIENALCAAGVIRRKGV